MIKYQLKHAKKSLAALVVAIVALSSAAKMSVANSNIDDSISGNQNPTHVSVAIDVGHSIRKPGATSASGMAEFKLNQQLASDIAQQLNNTSFKPHLIGADGKMDILKNRTQAAVGDALFVSIHHDSIPLEWMPRATDFSGFSIFISHKNPYPAQSLACARELGRRLIAAGFSPSRYHALPVAGQNRAYADEPLGVHYFDDLIVLKAATQPALLVETGVIVNPQDEQKVTANEGRQQLSTAIANGIKACIATAI